jgi:hypothetical protein
MATSFLIPDEYMVPVGAFGTKAFGRCADGWLDSEIAMLRAKLPVQFHAVPIDHLRHRWIQIRKKGTPGYRVNGKGPAIGSRKSRIHVTNPRYRKYLDGDDWKTRRRRWLDFWKKCALCGSEYRLEVHHNDYSRLGHEEFRDCVVLCLRCHNIFHETTDLRQAVEAEAMA